MTANPALSDLIARWRESEETVAEANKNISWRSWECQRWRVMVALAFWRDPTLDPYAIGFAEGRLAAADELEAALNGEPIR